MREIVLLCCSIPWIIVPYGCKARRAAVIAPATSASTADVITRYQAHRLAPARVAPPSLASRTFPFEDDQVAGEITLVLAEDEPWNTWSDTTARLFNNRTAHLFRIVLQPKEVGTFIRWSPGETTLELNTAGDPLYAAPNQEPLLEELVFWAFQQERAILDGDLVDRTRAAGELRRAYLDTAILGRLDGLIAFPLPVPVPGEPDPAEQHVVSMRLTLGVYVEEVYHPITALLQ